MPFTRRPVWHANQSSEWATWMTITKPPSDFIMAFSRCAHPRSDDTRKRLRLQASVVTKAGCVDEQQSRMRTMQVMETEEITARLLIQHYRH
jgi:hypothetical protein